MGKALSIIGGILTLGATFILSWFKINGFSYAYGEGGIYQLLRMFTNTQKYGQTLGIPVWLVYVFAIVVILVLAAGILQLIGTKSLTAAIIGSLLPIIIGVIILLYAFNIIGSNIIQYLYLFRGTALVKGIIPFDYAIGWRFESVGTYVLLAGGILGLIGGFKSRTKFK